MLKPGVNAAGFLLGNGFYNLAHRDRFTKLTGSFGPLRAILHLRLEYEDGAVGFVGTNSNWRTQSGPITVGHIFAGEDYDARLMPAGWAEPGFDDSKWRHAVELLRPQGVLRGLSVAGEPLRVIEMHQPIDVKSFSDGTRVYDFGQNASHMPRIRVNGPAGSVIRITPSEVVNPDGTINRNTMDKGNRGNAWWQYTKQSDREETWFPNFYYVGCRYVKAEGFASEADLPVKVPAEDSTFPSVPADAPRSDPDRAARLESIEMAVVHAAAAGTGRFESSNPLLNQIRDLVRWAQRSNMMSVLTDCPHREKLGWLEQYHLNGPAIRYEFDVARIFTKGMNDMADAQTDEGLIPNIAPEFTVFKGAFRAAAEWGASFLLVPWQQYEFNGDRALIETYYPAMKRYFSWLESRSRDDLLDEGLGDWFDLGPAKPGKAQNTPPIVTASAFFYYDAKLLSEAAALLGHADEAKAFAMRADQIKSSYNKKFFDPSRGVYATGSQAANALPLVMGLVDPAQKSRVLDALVRDIEQQGYATTAGDVGFRFVLRALADNNRSDVVYRMVCQREKPGYAYQLKQGATSLTEAWDSNLDTSHNHFMLGQVTEWFYHDLAGIAFDRAAPGFKHAIIRPQLPADLDWVEACHDSVHGPVAVRWERVGRQLTLHVSIPANTTASIHVPSRDGSDVTEGGSPVGRNHAGVRYLRREGDCSVYAVESGSYVFASQWQ
ncbi:hypothetical protein AW736_23080 [Termitidicoccus mucosus]|uniref:alpha-L-rhamnosidase n=1 Tax=Termitidicoccus mucosus TaxID=1184151 RepID=A0A178ICV9_9BACT|nr:hypothetical protein AW736_23080 [Opitutaceae bacterium TSB47]